MGKILGNKELDEVRSEVAALPVDGLDALRTVPVWAFCFLSKGCSSQLRRIFCGACGKTQTGAICPRMCPGLSPDFCQFSPSVCWRMGLRALSNATR
jgi:hypothetical protein